MDISGELKGDLGTTSTAGDDTFKAAVATLGSLDILDGGAGQNTFNIRDTADVLTLKGSVENFATMNVESEGSVGSSAVGADVPAVADTLAIDFNAPVAAGTVTFVVGGVETVVSTGADLQATVANAVAGIKAALQSLGYLVSDAGAASPAQPTASGTANTVAISFDNDVAGSNNGQIYITGVNTGAELPGITVKTASSAANIPALTIGEGALAETAGTATVFRTTAVDGLTTLNVTAGDEAIVRAATTTNVNIVEAGGEVSVTGGKDVDVGLSIGGATVKGAKGAVSVYEYLDGNVVVEGGTTVTVVKEGSELDATTGQATTAYAGNITVGAVDNFGANPATSTGYPQVDANVAKQPTGDVTIANYTNYTTLTGLAARVYGSGSATVYANGAKNVSVATAGAVTVKDVQTATRINAVGELAKAGTSTLSSVRLDGLNTSGSVISDALTSLTLVNAGASAAVTVTNAAAHALALKLGNNASGSAVTDASATSVVVTTEAQSISSATAASASTTTINADNATSLTFNNAHAVTLGNSAFAGLTKVTSVVATGAGKVALGDITGAAKLTSVDASTASGALTATIGDTGTYGLTLKGGSGADVITVKAGSTLASALVNGATVTTSIDLGAGNDTLVGTGTIGAGAVIDGGAGTDTIAQTLVTGTNAALFKNFETLEITGLATAFDGAAMTNSSIQNVALIGAGTSTTATTNTAEVRNLNTTAPVITVTQFTDQVAAAGNLLTKLTATLKTATGTADAATVNFAGAAAEAASVGVNEAGTINVRGSSQTVYGGTQADTINVFKGKATIDVGSDTVNAVDKVVINGPTVSATLADSVGGAEFTKAAVKADHENTANSAFTTSSALTTISNLVKGDQIDLTASGLTTGTVGDLITSLATNTSSEGVVTASTTLDGLVNQAITDKTKDIDWFVFQGNTYIVVNGTSVGDQSTLNASTNANANDYVIKLIGDYTASLTGVTALSSSVLTFG